jgi:hypothetical protein
MILCIGVRLSESLKAQAECLDLIPFHWLLRGRGYHPILKTAEVILFTGDFPQVVLLQRSPSAPKCRPRAVVSKGLILRGIDAIFGLCRPIAFAVTRWPCEIEQARARDAPSRALPLMSIRADCFALPNGRWVRSWRQRCRCA